MATPSAAASNGTDENSGWKFAQCFGDKSEVEEVSEGTLGPPLASISERSLFKPVFADTNALFHSTSVADIISAVEFDYSGDFLATGDKGGRVVLFERNKMVCPSKYRKLTMTF